MNILSLPPDILALLALDLPLEDIISYCSSNKRFNKYVCQKESFWLNKLLREYPYYKLLDTTKSYKDSYILLDKNYFI